MRPRSRTGIALALAVLVLSFLPARAAQATFPGRNGRIAFADLATGQIYAVNPDGTGLVQLTDTGPHRFAGDPAWSPDGTHIVFEKWAGDRLLLWIMDANGADKYLVADDRAGAFNFSPVYTPDGRRIVYTRCTQFAVDNGERVFTCRIYTIRTNGTGRRGVTTTDPPLEVFDFQPSISPDGTSIVFERHNQNYDGIIGQLYVMGIDGSNQQAMTAPRLEAWYPDWSPDGTQIAFSSACCRPGSRGYVMNADGTGVQRLTDTSFPHNDFQFQYSPNGNRMVFASDRALEPVCCDTDMFIMHADGSGQHRLNIGLPAPRDFSWGTAPLLSAASVPNVASISERSRPTGGRCSLVPSALRAMLGCS
jgi:TolB protein